MPARPRLLLAVLAVLVEVLAAAGASAVDPDALLRAMARPGIGGIGVLHRLDTARPPDQAIVGRSAAADGTLDAAHRRTPNGPAVTATSAHPPGPATGFTRARHSSAPTARTLSTPVGGRAPPAALPAIRQ